MTREEALAIIGKRMPSFGRTFNDSDIFGELGWLYRTRNGRGLPDVIPQDHLVGRTFEYRGATIRLDHPRNTPYGKSARQAFGTPCGRAAGVEYQQYPGHPHMYPTLEIEGVTGMTVPPSGQPEEFRGIYLLHDPEVQTHWSIDLMRIVPQEDIARAPYEWEYYSAGDRTNRFLDYGEILATAAYVCLLRIEGPFFLKEGNGLEYTPDDLLMTVGPDDTVTITDKFRKYV